MTLTLSSLLAGCSIDSHFIYYPQPFRANEAAQIAKQFPAALPLQFATPDGQQLHGWLTNPGGAKKPLVIYYGGNAEEVSWLLGEAQRFPNASLLLVNYRGYGASSGSPKEQALYSDATIVFDSISARPDIDQNRIALWGRSLGTGVATHVATQRKVKTLVLISPYDSFTALGKRHMPLLSFMLTQPFDSISRAPQIKAPILAVTGGRDTIIPAEHSRRFLAAAGGETEHVGITNADHNDLQNHPEYWNAIERWLAARL